MNTSVAFVAQVSAILMGFFTRVVFTRMLSEGYVGINGLFTDILNILSLSELGVGTAITYALYAPIAKGDIKKQQILMRMFRSFYRMTALFVMGAGLCLIPFLDILMKDRPDVDHLVLIYCLYLLNSVVSYLLIYKKTLIDAHQMNYITVLYHNGFLVLQDVCQIIILITTKKASRKAGLGVSYGFNMMFNTLYQYPMYQNVYGSGNSGQLHTGINTYDKSWYDPSLPYGMTNLTTDYSQLCFGMPMLGFDVIGRNGQVKKYVPGDNNISGLYQTGYMMTNSVSIDKVAEIASIRFSYTNIHADDILKNFNNLDRHNFNLNSTAKFTNFLSMDLGARYVYEHADNRGFRGNSNRNPLWVIANLPRDATMDELIPWKNPDGTAKTQRGFNNPFWLLNELSNEDYKHWFMGNVTLNVTFTNYLKLRLRAATDMQT